MKLCIDCKHRFGLLSDRCRVPAAPWEKINVVTGQEIRFGNDSCVAQRVNFHKRPDACGRDGTKWEAKTT